MADAALLRRRPDLGDRGHHRLVAPARQRDGRPHLPRCALALPQRPRQPAGRVPPDRRRRLGDAHPRGDGPSAACLPVRPAAGAAVRSRPSCSATSLSVRAARRPRRVRHGRADAARRDRGDDAVRRRHRRHGARPRSSSPVASCAPTPRTVACSCRSSCTASWRCCAIVAAPNIGGPLGMDPVVVRDRAARHLVRHPHRLPHRRAQRRLHPHRRPRSPQRLARHRRCHPARRGPRAGGHAG